MYIGFRIIQYKDIVINKFRPAEPSHVKSRSDSDSVEDCRSRSPSDDTSCTRFFLLYAADDRSWRSGKAWRNLELASFATCYEVPFGAGIRFDFLLGFSFDVTKFWKYFVLDLRFLSALELD